MNNNESLRKRAHPDDGDSLILEKRPRTDESERGNFQHFLGGLNAYFISLLSQLNKANEDVEVLKESATKSSEHASEVDSEHAELQKKRKELSKENKRLKAELAETEESNAATNQELQSKIDALKKDFEQLQVDKKLVDDELIAEKKKAVSLTDDNTKVSLELELAQQEHEDLKLKIVNAEENNVVASQKLQAECDALKQRKSDLKEGKKLVEDMLAAEKKTVALLTNYNSNVSEKLKLSQQGNEEWKTALQLGITLQRIRETIKAIDLPKPQLVQFVEDMEKQAEDEFKKEQYESAISLYLKATIVEEFGRQDEAFLGDLWKKISLCHYRLERWEQASHATEKAAEYNSSDHV